MERHATKDSAGLLSFCPAYPSSLGGICINVPIVLDPISRISEFLHLIDGLSDKMGFCCYLSLLPYLEGHIFSFCTANLQPIDFQRLS